MKEDFDVVCVQEHKLHFAVNTTGHCHNYTLFFGGTTNGYSGVLTIIKDNLCPTVILNHHSGRALFIEIIWDALKLCIVNIYGFNAAVPRAQLWDWLGAVNDEPVVMEPGDCFTIEVCASLLDSSRRS